MILPRGVDVDLSQVDAIELGDAVPPSLLEDDTLMVFFERRQTAQLDGYAWIGHPDGHEHSQVSLTAGGWLAAGNITLPGARYQIASAADDVRAIYSIDQSAFPPEAEPEPPKE